MNINFNANRIIDDVRAVQAYIDKLEAVVEVAASIVTAYREAEEIHGWEMSLMQRRLEAVGREFDN